VLGFTFIVRHPSPSHRSLQSPQTITAPFLPNQPCDRLGSGIGGDSSRGGLFPAAQTSYGAQCRSSQIAAMETAARIVSIRGMRRWPYRIKRIALENRRRDRRFFITLIACVAAVGSMVSRTIHSDETSKTRVDICATVVVPASLTLCESFCDGIDVRRPLIERHQVQLVFL
jgi:hypothetical protein